MSFHTLIGEYGQLGYTKFHEIVAIHHSYNANYLGLRHQGS